MSKPLSGYTFAVSTTGVPQKQIEQLVTSHGGAISKIVHRRINFLIATNAAVAKNTQAVRKAREESGCDPQCEACDGEGQKGDFVECAGGCGLKLCEDCRPNGCQAMCCEEANECCDKCWDDYWPSAGYEKMPCGEMLKGDCTMYHVKHCHCPAACLQAHRGC